MATHPRSDRERAIRLLLLFYPRWFRRARGDDLTQSYRDAIEGARRENRSELGLWTWLVADAASGRVLSSDCPR